MFKMKERNEIHPSNFNCDHMRDSSETLSNVDVHNTQNCDDIQREDSVSSLNNRYIEIYSKVFQDNAAHDDC